MFLHSTPIPAGDNIATSASTSRERTGSSARPETWPITFVRGGSTLPSNVPPSIDSAASRGPTTTVNLPVTHRDQPAQSQHGGVALSQARLELLSRKNEGAVAVGDQQLTFANATTKLREALVEWSKAGFSLDNLQSVSSISKAIVTAASENLPTAIYRGAMREIDSPLPGKNELEIHTATLTRMLDTAAAFQDTGSYPARAALHLLPAACLASSYADQTASKRFSAIQRHELATKNYFAEPSVRTKWPESREKPAQNEDNSVGNLTADKNQHTQHRHLPGPTSGSLPSTVVPVRPHRPLPPPPVHANEMAGPSTPETNALADANMELIYRQHLFNINHDNQSLTLADAKNALEDSLLNWTNNHMQYKDLTPLSALSKAIMVGASTALKPQTCATAIAELRQQAPSQSDPDQLHASLKLALDHAAAFVPDMSGNSNSKHTGFIAAAWFIDDYAKRLATELNPAQSHEDGVRRFNQNGNGHDSPDGQPIASGSVINTSEKAPHLTDKPVTNATPENQHGTLKKNSAAALTPPWYESKVLRSEWFEPDHLVAQHAGDLDPYVKRCRALAGGMNQRTSVGPMLTQLKREIAALPVAPQVHMYRAQRQRLMHSVLERLMDLPMDEKAAGQLVRELRRLVAPERPSSLRSISHRTHAPKDWQPHIAAADFDSRDIISDGSRAEFCTRALSLPLPESASLHVLKTMKHWLDKCAQGEWLRSPNEYTATLTALAMLRADPPASFTPKCDAYAAKILEAHSQKLRFGSMCQKNSTAERNDFADRLANVERARKTTID